MTGAGLAVDVVPRFSHPDAEYCFQKYYRLEARHAFQRGCTEHILFNAWLICAEIIWNLSNGSCNSVIICRSLIILFLLLSKRLNQTDSAHREYLIPASYVVYGAILLVLHTILTYNQDTMDISNYFFFAGRWSMSDAVVYTAFCFNTALRFSQAFTISSIFITAFTVLPFLLYYPEYEHLLLDHSVFMLPAMLVLCILSAQDLEINVRLLFLRLNRLGHDLRRRDTLIHSILPENISDALKKGDKEKLATHHNNVSILFCLIVDFDKHSSSCHAEDIVKLLIRVVTLFDKIVEHMGVYKVENIADTYMCCDGLNRSHLATAEDIVHTEEHASKIARTAIAMREAADYFQWRWPDGSPVIFKLGIHTGPVTAGVIGTKSYSYHLFGDTVNTASRMCTCSLPGQITVSKSVVSNITKHCHSEFSFHNRGKVEVKGKGLMELYWLDGYQSEIDQEPLADVYAINSRKDLSQNIGRFLGHPESEKDMSIRINTYHLGFINAQSSAELCDIFHVLDGMNFTNTTFSLLSFISWLHGGGTRFRSSTPSLPLDSSWSAGTATVAASDMGDKGHDARSTKTGLTASTQRISNSTWATTSSRFSSREVAALEALDGSSEDYNPSNTSQIVADFELNDTFTRNNFLTTSNGVIDDSLNENRDSDRHLSPDFDVCNEEVTKTSRKTPGLLENCGNGKMCSQRPLMESAADAKWLNDGVEQCRYDRHPTHLLQPKVSSSRPAMSSSSKYFHRSLSDSDKVEDISCSNPPNNFVRSRSYDLNLNKQMACALPCSVKCGSTYKMNSYAELDRHGILIHTPKERRQSSINVSDMLRRGSSILSTGFLHTNTIPKGEGSWMSSSSDRSDNKQKSTSDILSQRGDEDENIRIDAFVEHSSYHNTIMHSQAILCSKAVDLENKFRERSNKQNVDQCGRVLFLLLLYQLFQMFADDFMNSNVLGLLVVAIGLLYLRLSEKSYRNIQAVGVTITVLLMILYGISWNIRARDSLILKGSSLIIFVVVNLHLRLRFSYCALLSSGILGIILLHMLRSSDSIESWRIVVIGYYVFITASSLAQCYAREKSQRINFRRLQSLQNDTVQSRQLLENMLPRTIHAQQLLRGELVFDELHNVTLLYSDIKGFTSLSARLKPQVLCKLLNLIYSAFDSHLEHFGLYKVDTIGDAFVVVGGLPGYSSQHNHALSCLQFALHMQNDMKVIRNACGVDVELRIGIHTGSVIGSVVSLNKPKYLLWGSATQVAGAMEAYGTPGSIQISSETAKVLDADDLSYNNIALSKQNFDPSIALFTESTYIATCSDLHPFFHDTWVSGYSPAKDESSEFDTTILRIMGNIAKQLHNNLRGVETGVTTTDSDLLDDITRSNMSSPRRKAGSLFNASHIDSFNEAANSDVENASIIITEDETTRDLRSPTRKISIMNAAATIWGRVASFNVPGAVLNSDDELPMSDEKYSNSRNWPDKSAKSSTKKSENRMSLRERSVVLQDISRSTFPQAASLVKVVFLDGAATSNNRSSPKISGSTSI